MRGWTHRLRCWLRPPWRRLRRPQRAAQALRRDGRQADRHEVRGLRRTEERARALAPARGLGLQPLAPVRRAAPRTRARHHARRPWGQLRDDHRTLAQLAARHGLPDPRRLAAALVAPEAANVGAARAAVARAPRPAHITQGHLAQHLFFHSLHQFAHRQRGARHLRRDRRRVPAAAPRASSARSPSRGSNGRSPGSCRGAARSPCCASARATGVRGDAIPSAQADRLLRRQLSQLPRWLDQARYNGPPTTYRGALERRPARLRLEPGDLGRRSPTSPTRPYRQKLPLAIKFGEIAVLRADLSTGKTAIVSRLPSGGPTGPDPISAYNPTVSRDGRASRSSPRAGNQNFAKRYGRIGRLCPPTARPRRTRPAPARTPRLAVGLQPGDVRRRLARRLPGRGATAGRSSSRATRGGRTRTVVRGARAGGARFGDPYDPVLSADGSSSPTRRRAGASTTRARRDVPGAGPRRAHGPTCSPPHERGRHGTALRGSRALARRALRRVHLVRGQPRAAPGRAGLFSGTSRGPHAPGPDRDGARRSTRSLRRGGGSSPSPRCGTARADPRLEPATGLGLGRSSGPAGRRRLVGGRLDLRRRPSHRLRLGGDEPRPAPADGTRAIFVRDLTANTLRR